MSTPAKPKRKQSKTSPVALLCGGGALLLALLHLFGFAPLIEAEFYSVDQRIKLGRKAPLNPDLLFVAIDQRSVVLDHFDPATIEASPALSRMRSEFPWPRDVYALVLDRLFDAGARAVGIDLLFPGPRAGDDAFRDALDRHGGRVVIGANFADDQSSGSMTQFAPPTEALIPHTSPIDPRVGYVNFWPDIDEVVRHARYRLTQEELFGVQPGPDADVLESFSARLAAQAGHADKIPPGLGRHMIRPAPIDRTKGCSFVPISIAELFDPVNWEHRFQRGAFFKDKIVLIGPLGDWAQDYIRCWYRDIPGPEMHLHALNAILERQFLRTAHPSATWVLLAASAAAAIAISLRFTAPVGRVATFAAVSAAYAGAAQLAYDRAGLILPVVLPLLGLNLGGFASSVWDFVVERIERTRTRRALERYVSRNVVKELLDNPDSWLDSLGGVRKPVTILFSDLRGFTTLTETADSAELVARLNEYFSAMVARIFSHGGTLDKFIGDAIMAVWGNIQSDGPAADARRAVAAALDLRDALDQLNRRWQSAGLPTLAMGIGINHGEAVVGNIGSAEKMELTVIGDPVNLASRLEGLTKEYGLDLLLGEAVADLVRGAFHLQPIDRVRVKGKARPVDVFTVHGPAASPLDPAMAAYLERFETALAHYRNARFAEAATAFREALGHRPDDPVAPIYIARCEGLRQNPPEQWDGVFVMTKK